MASSSTRIDGIQEGDWWDRIERFQGTRVQRRLASRCRAFRNGWLVNPPVCESESEHAKGARPGWTGPLELARLSVGQGRPLGGRVDFAAGRSLPEMSLAFAL